MILCCSVQPINSLIIAQDSNPASCAHWRHGVLIYNNIYIPSLNIYLFPIFFIGLLYLFIFLYYFSSPSGRPARSPWWRCTRTHISRSAGTLTIAWSMTLKLKHWNSGLSRLVVIWLSTWFMIDKQHTFLNSMFNLQHVSSHNLSQCLCAGAWPCCAWPERAEWPVREDQPPAWQEAQAGDKDQEEDSQPQVEWDFLLRGVCPVQATDPCAASPCVWPWQVLQGWLHRGDTSSFVPGEQYLVWSRQVAVGNPSGAAT